MTIAKIILLQIHLVDERGVSLNLLAKLKPAKLTKCTLTRKRNCLKRIRSKTILLKYIRGNAIILIDGVCTTCKSHDVMFIPENLKNNESVP